jgi:hypothetical protein
LLVRNKHQLVERANNLVHDVTGIKTIICCGILLLKLNDVDTNTQQDQLPLTNVQFHVPNELAESFKEGTFFFYPFIHDYLHHTKIKS